jgi:hypothetical protein
MRIAAALLAITICAAPLTAGEENHMPLSAKIMTAKTIYIDNRSGMAQVGDRAYDELKNWGRFQVVTDRKQADLILVLSVETHSAGPTTVSILDPATGDTLWESTHAWRGSLFVHGSATRDIIKDLRKRVEEQQRQQP